MSSSFELLGADGMHIPPAVSLKLNRGEARLFQVRACAETCTSYQFDVHRKASAQAALSQLLVSTEQGRQDIALSPPFSPGVLRYRAKVPHKAEANLMAVAARGGFVSFHSFAAAERHAESLRVAENKAVIIYVVAPDRRGECKYRVVVRHRANMDSSLHRVWSNAGSVVRFGNASGNLFLLKVPLQTSRVGISASARDRKGANVTVHGSTGQGYASAVVRLHEQEPFRLVHVRVAAEDGMTASNHIVIVCHGLRSLALLSSLSAQGCELRPHFSMLVRRYRCLLGSHAKHLTIVPTALRTPAPMVLSVDKASLGSGQPWTVPLDADGRAEVSVLVTAADGVHSATYHVSARGSPVRIPTTSTTVVRTTLQSTVVSSATTTTSIFGVSTSTITMSTSTTRAHWWERLDKRYRQWRAPHWIVPHWRMPNWSMPHVQRPHWYFSPPHVQEIPSSVFVTLLQFVAVCSSVVALLGSVSLVAALSLTKHLQFAALAAGVVAPLSVTGQLVHPFGFLCLWISFSHGQAHEDAARRLFETQYVDVRSGDYCSRAGCLGIFAVLLPCIGLLLGVGWRHASEEEKLAQRGALPHLAWRHRLLPCGLVMLDLGLIGFTDAVAAFLFRSPDQARNCEGPPNQVLVLTLAYPFGFGLLGAAQLCWLRHTGQLAWSQRFRLFADRASLAVVLPGPWHTVAPLHRRLPALAKLLTLELRHAVAIRGVDGGPFCLSRGWSDFSRSEQPSDPEVEASLLPAYAGPLWQQQQQHLDLLLWVERRCAAYDALKRQVQGAELRLAITDVQGAPIFDALGEPLTTLYQYCFYQFPWRPWRSERQAAAPVPYECEAGIVASWVLPAEEIGGRERRLIDAWLERWLSEARTVVAAHGEWQKLKSRECDVLVRQEGFAVLRELVLALLEGEPLRLEHENTEERELRVGELLSEQFRKGEPLHWQGDADKAEVPEAFVTLSTERLADAPETFGSAFGIKRLQVRSPSETQHAASVDAVLREHDVVQPLSRQTFTGCQLPLAQLQLLSMWMPPFGFCVPCDALALPVLEAWAPLYPTSAGCGALPGALLLDVAERVVAALAILAARAAAATDTTLAALVFLLWTCTLLALRLLAGAGDSRLCTGKLPELVLSLLLLMMTLGPPRAWHTVLLDWLCAGLIVAALFVLAQRTLRALFAESSGIPTSATGRRASAAVASPSWGACTAIDAYDNGESLPFMVVVPLLGMCLHADACHEEEVITDERRVSACKKQLCIYEAPPDTREGPAQQLHDLDRLDEIWHAVPLALSRAQLAGTEELHQLACTIQVVNHVGCSWSSPRHDSFLSLYVPWGRDLMPGARREYYGTDRGDQESLQDADDPALLKAWQQEVVNWLYGELASAGTTKHTALDTMLHGGCADRGVLKTESDRRVVPGIFSQEGIGEHSYSDSRCYREGRVLHYVIRSTELKAGLAWRPDPLAAEAGHLLASDQWRPCLLRLTSRSVSYSLRKSDDEDQGGPFPSWREPPLRDHGDLVEYNVSFLFLDRVEVEVQRGLVTLQERDRDILGDAVAVPEYAPRSLPLIFRVGLETAHAWKGVVRKAQMSRRREHILNYVGPVCEHPRLPGVFCRHGAEGEQLWDNGLRYTGSWEWHTYHGHGELVDAEGQTVYRGQWRQGLKHGDGTYFFRQGDVQRCYLGQWVRDEFNGMGELRILEQSLEILRRRQPYMITHYKGRFDAATCQFTPGPELSELEAAKHGALIQAHFPTRAESTLSSSTISTRPLAQACGEPPQDFATALYRLDGGDLAHCGPDEDCRIRYADGCRYAGACLAGAVPHGCGILVEPNGARYEGSFDQGRRQGPGVVTLANGVVYEGQLAYPGGKRDGQGRLTVPPALQSSVGFVEYVGQFVSGLRTGHGRVTFPDGAEYVGEFERNRRHGHGRISESRNVTYEGPWDSDQPAVGDVAIVYSTGHCYSGQAQRGARQGAGIVLDPNGEHWALLYDGEWSKDRMHGQGELICPDGTYRGQFVFGEREGMGRFEYRLPKAGSQLPSPHGLAEQRSYEGQWRGDQPHGTGKYADEYGYVLEETVCERGVLKSERRPPRKGLGRLLPQKVTEFAPFAVQLNAGRKLPGASSILTPRNELLPVDPPALQGLDTGEGYAHGRSRPAHMGFEGVPGSRWA